MIKKYKKTPLVPPFYTDTSQFGKKYQWCYLEKKLISLISFNNLWQGIHVTQNQSSLFFVALLTTFFSCQPTIISTALFTLTSPHSEEEESKEQAEKKIILFGDRHSYFEQDNNTPQQVCDKQHKKSLFALLKACARRKEKTAVLIESHFDQPTLYAPQYQAAEKHNSYIGLFCALPKHAYEQDYQEGNVTYIPFDLRSTAIRSPIQFFLTFTDVIDALSAHQKTQYSAHTVPQLLLKRTLTACEHLFTDKTTIAEYLDALTNVTATTQNTSCGDLITHLLHNTRDFFAPYHHSTPINTVFFSIAQENRDTLLEHIENIFMPLNKYLGHASLELEMQRITPQFNTIIVFAGASHTIALYPQLFKTYTPMLLEGLQSVLYENQHPFAIPACSEHICTQVMNLMHPQAQQVLCANCSEQLGIKQCGRCKQEKYCSLQCQKTHWKHHKQNCHAR